jgi:hypothetical protein
MFGKVEDGRRTGESLIEDFSHFGLKVTAIVARDLGYESI